MERFLKTLEELLPDRLHAILAWDFLPFRQIKERHGDLSRPHLAALFESYQHIGESLDLEVLATRIIPVESWGCMRCGFCCTSMRPGSVSASVYRGWVQSQAPVARFYRSSGLGTGNRDYSCWYHGGVRLRMCPFMFINGNDSRPFCALYHMGDSFRPSVCSRYVPRHGTCTTREFRPEPWESR